MKRISLLMLAVLLLAFVQVVSAGIAPATAEYFFTEIKGSAAPHRVVPITVTNSGPGSITINSASFTGTNASEFSFSTAPMFPLTLAANASVTYNVVFAPPSSTTYTPPYPPSAIRTASLQINSTDATTPILNVALYGLSTNGTGGNNEPRLQMVTDILGYDTKVGTTAYLVRPEPEDFTPIADEVVAQLFEKADVGSVTMTAVMRWSPTGVINYGYYFPDGTFTPAMHEVNRMSNSNAIANGLNHQTLMPATATSNITFDPGSQPFGVYVASPALNSYSEDALNIYALQRTRAARTFVVRNRNGTARPNTYLVVFEDSTNGDYQDFGFLLTNVRIAADTSSPAANKTTVVPANGATGVSGTTNITIPFNEVVTAAPSAFTLTCGTVQPFVLTGSGTTTLILDPTNDLSFGATCTLVGTASGITDTLGNPLISNFNLTFTVPDTLAPTVVTANVVPANNATGVSGSSNITIPFSENVTATGSAFTLTCGTAQPFTLIGSGTSTLTLDPTNTLASGASCTVIGSASGITDSVGQPLASDFNLAFTIADTIAPTVITANVVPANNATNVAGNTDITLPFSEAVTAAESAFTLTCGTAQTFALTGSGTSTLVLNPNADLPSGASCSLVGSAAGITDAAGNALASDINLAFTIADTVAPIVITANVVPANSATNVAGNTNITLPFSENVTAAESTFTLTCGTVQTFALTGSGTSTLVLNPNANLPSGASCTLVGTASGIADAAGNALASNISLAFTIADTIAPTVITANVVPVNNATNVAGNTDITLPFSEAVTAAESAFTLTCGTAQTFALIGSGTSTLVLNPTADLPSGASCTLVGSAAGITDGAGNALASDVNLAFTIADTIAPTLIAANVVPANNATNVAGNTDITLPFSEAVTAAESAFTLTCDTAQTFALTGSGTSTLVLNPNADLPSGSTCTLVGTASGITDGGGNALASNVNLAFTIADTIAPTLIAANVVPANNATNVPGNTDITLPFSEAVTAAENAFTLTCGTAQTFALTGSGTSTLVLNPNADLPSGSSCSLVGTATGITDAAGNALASDVNLAFTIADTIAPTLIAANVVPANNATNVPDNTDITLPFSEAVTAAESAFTLTCGTAQTFALTGSGTSTLVLNPTADLPSGSTCTLVGTASGITDGAGNALASDINLAFTIADTIAPTLIAANVVPANNATNVAGSTDITLPFSEAVTAAESAFTLTCGTAQTFVLTGSGTSTLVLNPNADLPSGASCALVGTASGITDASGNVLASDINLAFTVVDSITPTVALTTPAVGTSAPVASDIVLTFSKPVNLGANPVTLACPASTNIAFTTTPAVLPATGVTVLTLNPTANLPLGVACRVTVAAGQAADEAGNQLGGTTVFNFMTVIDPAMLNQAPTPNVFVVSTPTLTWSRISWAVSYDVQIDTDPAFAAPHPAGYTAVLNVTTNSLTLPTALPAGTYYFRVRGKLISGAAGAFSAAEAFMIIED